MKSIAIVGAGISGLSAAYYLVKAGFQATLIEESPRWGGVIRTDKVDGCLVEAGPDSFIAQKPWALELIRELGLGDEVIGSQDHLRRTYVLRDGRLIPLPDGIQFLIPTKIRPMLTTRLLSPGAKLRMGLELLRRPAAGLPDRSVASFVIDHYGREVNDYLAQPMLAGVYGGTPEDLSINAVMPRMVELEQRYGSVTRGTLAAMRRARAGARTDGRSKQPEAARGSTTPRSLFLSLKGGMQQLTDTLASRLEGKVRRVHGAVEQLRGSKGAYELVVAGDSIAADEVVLAVPAYRAAPLVGATDETLADLLDAVPYNSSITAALLYPRAGFEHPLNGFGFLVPRAEDRPLTACTWVNTKFPFRAADDRVLLRTFFAAERAAGCPDLDEDVAQTADRELRDLMGFRQRLADWRVQRWNRAMAQYAVGHIERQKEVDARLSRIPGLWLTGNAYIGIGIPDCIRRSRQVAEGIAGAGPPAAD